MSLARAWAPGAVRGRGSSARDARRSTGRSTRAVTRRALWGADDERASADAGRITVGCALALAMTTATAANAISLPEEREVKVLCDEACETELATTPMETLPSGLQFKEIKTGDGETVPVGFQVVVDYIAMDEKGRIFDNSLDKGKPNDIRVVDCVGSKDFSSCTVIPGLDQGLLSMKSGGIRRLYIPGELSFPKGLASAPGRPKVPPFSPVVFDVALRYIPGFD